MKKENVCFLGIGLYWGWVFLACLSKVLFPAEETATMYFLLNELLSLVFYVLALLFATVTARSFMVNHVRRWPYVLPFLAAFGTILVVIAPYAPEPLILSLVIIGSVLTGLGSGVLLVIWARVFVTFKSEEAPRQIILALFTAIAVFLLTAFLPRPLPDIAAILLLPVSCVLCILVRWDADQTIEEQSHLVPSGLPYPWKLGVGLLSTGFAFGLLFGLTLTDMQMGTELALICLLVNGCIGIAVLIYTSVTGRNIGFSSAYMAILPLLGVGFLVLTALGTPFLLVSLFLVRAGYSLFDTLVWLQLPKVYRMTHSIKGFTASRLCLDGGVVLGLVLFYVLLVDRPFLLNFILLGTAAVFLLTLTISLNENPTHAWHLLPVSSKSYRYQQACEMIRERHGLTNREVDVLSLLARGRSGSYVREKLCISQNTFQTHSRNIYRKLNIHSREDLIKLFDEVINSR
ncbi:MAG: helix-turn-helix transcriptional regulator [Coriobacteriales bacterium]|jgi:DNA-binding CsgD family transcriptional regulator|nr:helix-turn-helix transcriptional regulator [Coriobacteriales bacterium]